MESGRYDGTPSFKANRFPDAAKYVYNMVDDGLWKREVGIADHMGFFALVNLTCQNAKDIINLGWKPIASEWPRAAILSETGTGAVWVAFYTKRKDAIKEFDEVIRTYEDYYAYPDPLGTYHEDIY